MRFDALTLFGVVSLAIMLFCYAMERKSLWYTLGMGAACIAASAYGFLQGAWPFGVLEAIWGRYRLSPLVAGFHSALSPLRPHACFEASLREAPQHDGRFGNFTANAGREVPSCRAA